MEILAEGKNWFAFICALVFIGLVLSFFATVLFFSIKECFQNFKGNIFGVIAGFVGTAWFTFLFIMALVSEDFDYLKVKIIDHNEVYEQGYKIDSREGEIFKISKRVE